MYRKTWMTSWGPDLEPIRTWKRRFDPIPGLMLAQVHWRGTKGRKRRVRIKPIVVDRDFRIIEGLDRFEVCNLFSWKTVPIVYVDDVLAEWRRQATTQRKYKPSEALRKADAIRAVLGGLARQRQFSGRSLANNFPGGQRGRVRDLLKKYVGFSYPTLEKIRIIVEAAWEDAEQFEPLRKQMDRTRSVDAAWRKVRGKLEAMRTGEPRVPQGPLREVLRMMRDQVADALPRERFILLDEYGKRDEHLGRPTVLTMRSTYPAWMETLGLKKTRPNAQRGAEVIDDIMQGRANPRTEKLRQDVLRLARTLGLQWYDQFQGMGLPLDRT
jgi:hypothetical protein